MNLYRIYRTDEIGYDEYDSAVVAAAVEEEAKEICPNGLIWMEDGWYWPTAGKYGPEIFSWVNPDQVSVELLGTAKEGTKRGVIVASFNAG